MMKGGKKTKDKTFQNQLDFMCFKGRGVAKKVMKIVEKGEKIENFIIDLCEYNSIDVC